MNSPASQPADAQAELLPELLPEPLPRVPSSIRFVLVAPSHPGNIGSTARALKTMGFSRLELVAPRFEDALSHPDALALASGAQDVLQQATIHTTLDEALAGCAWSAALTSREREYAPPETTPRVAAVRAMALGASGQETAFVFGSERYGLDNEDVLKCQACCVIPANPAYASLNLAQAVQIVAYECRMAALQSAWENPSMARPANTMNTAHSSTHSSTHSSAHPSENPAHHDSPLATHEEREQLLAHLEEAMIAVDFLDPAQPKKLMPRLRRLFARSGLEREEVHILRGLCKSILQSLR